MYLPRGTGLRQPVPSFDVEHCVGLDAGQRTVRRAATHLRLRSTAADPHASTAGGNAARSCKFGLAHKTGDLDHHAFALLDFLQDVLLTGQAEPATRCELAA